MRAVRGGLNSPDGFDQYRSLVTQGLQACDAIASPTRWMAMELARHYDDLPPSYLIRQWKKSRAAGESPAYRASGNCGLAVGRSEEY